MKYLPMCFATHLIPIKEIINFSTSTTPIKAPDFVMYVKKYLDDKYGEDYLKEKGLRVYTTLNWDLQQYSEPISILTI